MSKLSKQARLGVRWSMEHYPHRTLKDCYDKPSYYKEQAYREICDECVDNHGYNLTVTGYNCHYFSMAYLYNDPETGVIMCVYHTYANKYIFEY